MQFFDVLIGPIMWLLRDRAELEVLRERKRTRDELSKLRSELGVDPPPQTRWIEHAEPERVEMRTPLFDNRSEEPDEEEPEDSPPPPSAPTQTNGQQSQDSAIKKKRGRPRKNPLPPLQPPTGKYPPPPPSMN